MPRAPLLETPTVTAAGATIGRPRKEPPDDAAERITALAADGFSIKGVALRMGANEDVLRRWFDEYPALKEAFDAGRENERHALHNKLYRTATEGTGKEAIVAALFLLKARHGYREGEQDGQANRVSITFNLPGALKPEQFGVIENEPDH